MEKIELLANEIEKQWEEIKNNKSYNDKKTAIYNLKKQLDYYLYECAPANFTIIRDTSSYEEYVAYAKAYDKIIYSEVYYNELKQCIEIMYKIDTPIFRTENDFLKTIEDKEEK